MPVPEQASRDRLIFFGTCVLAAVSAVPLLVFFAVRWLARPSTGEQISLGAYVVLLGMLLVLGRLRKRTRQFAFLALLALASTTFALCLAEVGLSTFPHLLPDKVLAHNARLMLKARGLRSQDVQDILEHLQESPWVKFRPNVRARSMGYLTDRGDRYAFDWLTDSLGFKNEPPLAHLTEVTAVAIGDSFVEAMGAPIPHQWTSLLTQAGFPTYNLGVQGYAPQQMVGALRRYGLRFQPRIVLFGYTPGFEGRSRAFSDPSKVVATRRYQGGIEASNQYLNEVRKIEYRILPALNAILTATETRTSDILRDGVLKGFRFRQHRGPAWHFDANSPDWKQTVAAILEAKSLSRERGASLAIVLFRQQPFVYYEETHGTPPPETHYEVQLTRALQAFCQREGIFLLDTYEEFRKYIAAARNSQARELYFSDGHPNYIGQQLIANTILRFFEQHRLQRKLASRS